MAPDFFDRPADLCARELIGAGLLVDGVGGRIVEAEAYDADDPASHSFRGPSARNAPMFGPPGRAYVYRIYGLHWCFNIVCDAKRPGSAVLVRALEPTAGLEAMRARRRVAAAADLCSGPGKLCQALGIDGRLNGASVLSPPFAMAEAARRPIVVQGRRIGISVGVETPWRFAEVGSRFLSRPMERLPA
jgi:DNA-3-methyladenine glycosylase